MATGIEVAGLVLGALPLLLEGLKFYAEGVDTAIRFWKYREGVKGLISELGAEQTIYLNSIEIMIHGVVDARDVEEFLTKPGGDLWKRPKFEQKLRKRLGSSFDSYLDTISRMKFAVDAFRTKLKLDDAGKPQFSDKHTFKENYRRLRFSLNQAEYANLMGQIRQSNSTLKDLTFQRQNIEAQQQRVVRGSVPNFKRINRRAGGFYSAIKAGWKCPCHAERSVSLRLEPRMEDVSSDDDDDDDDETPIHDPFHVIFRSGDYYPAGSGVNPNIWIWDEADIHVTCERARARSTTVPTASHPRDKKGVRFVKSAVKAALEPEPNLQPIKDLCSAIGELRKDQRDVCFTLLQNEIVRQRFDLKIYPTKSPPRGTESWSVSTLRNTLQRGHEFSKRDRVRLSVILASSILQLYETPWLDDNWGIDNIYFVERPGSTVYDQPFVSRELDASLLCSKTEMPKHLERMIRNRPLFALGVTLIELWYGKPLSELHSSEDGRQDPMDPHTSFITRFNTACRLADGIADDAGARYSDAVTRCIRCDFGLRAHGLEDVQLQKAVFQGVVAQLKATQDFLG
ncbi:hypothetical protein OPT61_g882 [Boeremia exigua]|uniref:Uncharacterized protein n=1 Tax=Boeremia exigua TaxID=749465 RepID=A0ACC2ISC3_9PLEO|nr:hypothetical protein OPT61_g882 [Boeremia exigua]